MITNISIKNYKSIKSIEVPLARINVFIGENGAGKSNLLESIVLAGAASANKLDNEFLASRGIRVTQPEYMRSAFPGADASHPITISVTGDGETKVFELTNSNEPYSKWEALITGNDHLNVGFDGFVESIKDFARSTQNDGSQEANSKEVVSSFIQTMVDQLKHDYERKINDAVKKAKIKKRSQGQKSISLTGRVTIDESKNIGLAEAFVSSLRKQSDLSKALQSFIIFSPENTALRTFRFDGQVEPLGINGEGLLKLISVLAEDENGATLEEIKSSLKLLGWFEDLGLTDDVLQGSKRLELKDRYLPSGLKGFDQMSTNEGFLFLLFYFVLFSSDLTPKVFAVDNIDASLNPKLCQRLMRTLVTLAKKHDKQVILTTHNPAILDGLNLDDDDQGLFVVSRGRMGDTKIKPVKKPISKDGAPPVRLSEMFIKGILGGLPKGF